MGGSLIAREAMKELDRKVGPVISGPSRKSFLALEQSGKFKFQERDRAYLEKLAQEDAAAPSRDRPND